ncbi:alpha-tectorin [Carassius carassius]|uniref:alpha-tectorin n=1 Tax=Carassius carassius TaxID=217509 RepID=UPI002868445E|nr:alpha-tectorin [Carassius carassius]
MTKFLQTPKISLDSRGLTWTICELVSLAVPESSFSLILFLVPTNFLASGTGDTVNPPAEDGSSDVIFLQQPFRYFGRTYNQIFVNNNGYLTFSEPLSAYNPVLDNARDIVAPLWTRLDNRRGGTVSYREDTSNAVLAQVTAAVKKYFPNIPFAATSAFVATWDRVPYHNGGGVVTFQAVLVYNVHRSFILIYYGDVAETGQPWQAGYNTVDSASSFTIPAASVPDLLLSSNINVNASWSFHVDGSPNLPSNFLPFGNGEIVTPRLENGSSEAITLLQPLKFFGRTHNQTFVNNNGHLTFTEPLSDYIPLLNSGRDIIAPLWTHLDNLHGGTISYREDTNSSVLILVTAAVNQYFPNLALPFIATSVFVATWDNVPYFSGEGVVTFQVVFISNVDHSFILFNYGNIAETRQRWLALYDTVDFANSNSNVNVKGRWVFHVYDVCDTLGCTGQEVCSFRDAYGCSCLEGQKLNPETFDAKQFCDSSTSSLSLSRCQLFESGFPPEILHLNDPSCKGISENGRVLFHFDNDGHVCGTTLMSNGTHFIYQNAIHSNLSVGVITRERWMNIAFSCAYPLIQNLSMPKDIQAEWSVISIDLPGQGTYQIRMILYHDAQFSSPYEGDAEVQVNQQMYVAVEVGGVDRSQIATVLDNCWATPVNDIDHQIRWNLIIRECPNPEDGTVEVLQNGIDTTSRFSFRMFTFTGGSDQIFLHCQVHLCLVRNGRCAQSCNPGRRRRRRRSVDFHHTTAITMGF